jgi:N-acetylglucosamine repressor
MNYMTKRVPRAINQRSMKEENIKQIFCLISSRPEVTRTKLVRMTSLSPTTISTLVDELVEMRLVEETGQAVTNGAGRKPITLQINPQGRQIAMFSLNRWGIRYSLYDLAMKKIETRFVDYLADRYGGFSDDPRFSDPDAGEDYTALIESLLHASPQVDPAQLLVLCISFPGIYLEREQAFSWSAMHVSISCESIMRLESRVGIPVFLGNSSMSRAYAELKYMEKPGLVLQDLIFIYAFDGLGAGIIAGGDFLTGMENSAGEIGHVSVDYRGKRCACGRRGCVEQYVNLDALIKRVADALAARQAAISADALTLEAIGQAYDGGDEIIREQIDDIAAMLFTAIYSAVCITGIKRVVIGGGIEQLGFGFLRKLQSFTLQNPYNTLMRNLNITYALSGLEGDSEGIARFYLDNAFEITAARETAQGNDGGEVSAAVH